MLCCAGKLGKWQTTKPHTCPLHCLLLRGEPFICSGATKAEETMQWEAGMLPHCQLLPKSPFVLCQHHVSAAKGY